MAWTFAFDICCSACFWQLLAKPWVDPLGLGQLMCQVGVDANKVQDQKLWSGHK